MFVSVDAARARVAACKRAIANPDTQCVQYWIDELNYALQFVPHETKVQRLVRTCGIRMTALYLRNRGYTAEQAITLMFR